MVFLKISWAKACVDAKLLLKYIQNWFGKFSENTEIRKFWSELPFYSKFSQIL
jgi:hypothetical protein